MPQYLSKEEFEALKSLTQKKKIIIQKHNKGNSKVIFDRSKCIKNIENVLSDQSKFHKTNEMKLSWILLPVKKNPSIKFIKSTLTITASPKKYEDI